MKTTGYCRRSTTARRPDPRHVILCWLALLLVRIVETTTADTWNRIREDLQELHVGTFEGPAGTFRNAPS